MNLFDELDQEPMDTDSRVQRLEDELTVLKKRLDRLEGIKKRENHDIHEWWQSL